jgi:hypothetical protein
MDLEKTGERNIFEVSAVTVSDLPCKVMKLGHQISAG